MKKAISNIFLTVMFAGLLSGCGAEEKEVSGSSDAVQEASGGAESQDVSGEQEVSESDGQELSVSTGGILDPSAVLALSGKDNSLDVYSAAARAALQPEAPENAMEGGRAKSILGATGAYHFKKHLLTSAAESWDEVLFASGAGKEGSERYEHKNQLWDIGPVVGTDHYATLNIELQEDGECRYFLTERDENHEYLREFPLNFLRGSESEVIAGISDFMVDQSGTVHLVRGNGQQYQLVSQEGDILGECAPEGGNINRLVPLYDGRIAFEVTANGGGRTLQYMDGETGMPVSLAALKKEALCLTLLDEDTLLYADREGVYRSGLAGENPELIYRWNNHGIIAHGVSVLQADEDGRIALIYSDSENDNYLCLEPTTEERPLCQITMEVSSSDVESYEWVVAEFNKQYPSCHIELVGRDFGDSTTLLTQLTAGKGPVLLDPSMPGLDFEGLEELWEPLDSVLEQMGVTEELQPTALDMGKINGILYGIVRGFYLETVVADPELKDWDYDKFFQCVQESPEMEAICNYYDRESGIAYLLRLLNHGLDDNYFIVPDEETGAMHFDSAKFRQILDLAEKYCVREEGVLPGNSLLEGNALCNTLIILKPEDVAAYRTIYGEDVNYIGYPTKDGGTHFMVPSGMLAIRRSASKEEKEAAAAFLAMFLSYEGQIRAAKDINFQLSVRRDVLEEQIASMDSRIHLSGFGEVSMVGNMNIELDRTTLLDMIDRAKPSKSFPWELSDIIYEERSQYLSGSITKDMLIDHLENRIELYLGEGN